MMTRAQVSFVVLALALLSSCGAPQSVLSPRGTAAGSLSTLGWFVFILFLVVTAVMWGIIVLVVTRPRGSFQEHAPVDAGGGQGWVLIGGFAIPALILAAVFIYGLSAMTVFPVHDGMMMPPEIKVTGHQWWWQVQYMSGPTDKRFTTANEIHIPSGVPVDIDLTSDDVIHSFWVPSLHGKVDLIPGQENRIRIEADRPGTYRGQCGEYCGEEHANMILIVVADAPEQYHRWREHQVSEGSPPATAEQQQGQDVFLSHACSLCHTIRGTIANATWGPDLTHVGSRQRIAGNMLLNDEANLSAWVTHAQSLKPGAEMPNLGEFSGPELHELVAYLKNLR